MITDPVGDFITRLKNAGAVGKQVIEVPYSALRHAIADVLVAKGYLKSVVKRGKKVKKTLVVELAYEDNSPRIKGVERMSKPGRRMYAGAHEIRRVKFGKGTLVLSTSKGIRTGEDARKENVGGEQLFTIW